MNLNELAKEICLRESGIDKGLNITEVKTVLRILGDIEVEMTKGNIESSRSVLSKINEVAKTRNSVESKSVNKALCLLFVLLPVSIVYLIEVLLKN